MKLKTRIWLTLSQMVNSFCYSGEPDEGLSARSYREYVNETPGWEERIYWIDRLLGQGHCRKNYEAAQERANKRRLA